MHADRPRLYDIYMHAKLHRLDSVDNSWLLVGTAILPATSALYSCTFQIMLSSLGFNEDSESDVERHHGLTMREISTDISVWEADSLDIFSNQAQRRDSGRRSALTSEEVKLLRGSKQCKRGQRGARENAKTAPVATYTSSKLKQDRVKEPKLPRNWPQHLQYLQKSLFAEPVEMPVFEYISGVEIRQINSAGHPLCGEYGLFAIRK